MSGPLRYITVTAPDGEIIGYAWGSADDTGWIHRAASSTDAFRAGIDWFGRIRDAHRRGLTPAGVLELFSHEPGVGPVTEAPDMAALEELARIVTPADDRRLVDQLVPAGHPAWTWLAEAYDALTDADREVAWDGDGTPDDGDRADRTDREAAHRAAADGGAAGGGAAGGEPSGDGTVRTPVPGPAPVYSEQVQRVLRALQDLGAVTEEYRWMGHPLPEVPSSGRLSPADAVRAATALVCGERFHPGLVGDALHSGLLDAVVLSLRAWHAESAADGVSSAPCGRAEDGSGRQAPAVPVPVPRAAGGAPRPPQAPVRCRYCGGSPAVDVSFRAHRGLLVLLGFRRMDGPMCRMCGLGVHRALTTHTLCWGWWSPLSLVLFGPLTLVRNLLAVRRVARLAEPGPGLLGRRFDPGLPVHRRPRAYVALIPLVWVVGLIVVAVCAGG
ncbi:DUF6508 domain-containing protein [Streptomyces thermoviolaceus]|uniref:DUF6508 domain-containing protein n=1 Tax=Streptomyces thermoviolaceus TaxID=1952 RepID=UPI00167787AA|nr:DUF6508 domain-containing protein [Streptomyces thermoviolaceus]GGV59923.1 hypothetical protein GCM10010499_00020 [Streptomyces thermoviolaceus subsp. apingens]